MHTAFLLTFHEKKQASEQSDISCPIFYTTMCSIGNQSHYNYITIFSLEAYIPQFDVVKQVKDVY